MVGMAELRKKIAEYLMEVDEDVVTTKELRKKLSERDYVYNREYNVTIFSNAISSLAKKNVIISVDKDKKGIYRVDRTALNNFISKKYDEKKSGGNEENELEEMRKKIKKIVQTTRLEVEELLDSEKPSTYGRNKTTYNDILQLIDYLKKFAFTVEK